jgi:NAD(P)-dependent dehydrogenase (short-subunit alcohol dehydrogenase family)
VSRPRTIVITGGSSGIGLAAARRFAAQGDEVVLIGRHPQRLARAVERVREAGGRTPRSYRADFAVLDEVRALGDRLNADLDRIDVFANNAGALVPLTRRTADGFDVTMQVNHLAGFLLMHLVLDLLKAGAPARLITTASLAESWGWLDVDRPGASPLRFRSRWLAYGASKQANILFTVEAARRWGADGIVATSFFPGLVQSRFGRTSLLFHDGAGDPGPDPVDGRWRRHPGLARRQRGRARVGRLLRLPRVLPGDAALDGPGPGRSPVAGEPGRGRPTRRMISLFSGA